MGYLLCFLIFTAACYSVKAHTEALCAGAVTGCGESALKLVITLAGSMAIWGGILNLLEKSGAAEKLTKTMKPFICKIFKGIKKDGEAAEAISLNITANLLGLGNAATPLGLDAMKKIEAEEHPGGRTSANLTLLAVINACSLQLIPTTVSAIRASLGSGKPMEILPCVIIVSAISVTVAVLTAKALTHGR